MKKFSLRTYLYCVWLNKITLLGLISLFLGLFLWNCNENILPRNQAFIAGMLMSNSMFMLAISYCGYSTYRTYTRCAQMLDFDKLELLKKSIATSEKYDNYCSWVAIKAAYRKRSKKK
jgi:hypothetical protein